MNEIEILLVVIGTAVFLDLVGLTILRIKVNELSNELDFRGQQVADTRADYYQLRQEIKTLEKHFGVEIVHRCAIKEVRILDDD